MQIHIRDFVTIEDIHLHLQSGTIMVTGETGAGKSIFIEAIECALGERASSDLIRSGKDKAEISLCFRITKFPHVIDYLKQLDLYDDHDECIIRRVITSDGRSRSYINGTPSTLQQVKELGDFLFHLHGQHAQQVLLKNDQQREMLDRFADHIALANQVKSAALEWKSITQTIQILRDKNLARAQRQDYLQFQLNELNTLDLKQNEWESLEAEQKKLSHVDTLTQKIRQIIHSIHEAEQENIIAKLHEMNKIIFSISHLEPHAKEWAAQLDAASIQLNDLAAELNSYLEKTEIDPERLSIVEARVSQIFNLSRKYKITPESLFAFHSQLNDELIALQKSDETLNSLIEKQKLIEKNYEDQANKLSKSREKFANKLEKEITQTMRSLSLPHGEFKILLEKNDEKFPIHGREKIIFQIKTNPDQTFQALSKVISGGELSRLSLSLHLALAHRTSIPTLIFDEVDTGLSGAHAKRVGKLLQKLGETYQVFCITHQAQVAALGHHHLLVEKYFIENHTHTRLRLLSLDERTKEIARMLGGETITQKTMDHAKEVLVDGLG